MKNFKAFTIMSLWTLTIGIILYIIEAHAAGSAWSVEGRGGGGVRMFGRALAYGCWRGNVLISVRL